MIINIAPPLPSLQKNETRGPEKSLEKKLLNTVIIRYNCFNKYLMEYKSFYKKRLANVISERSHSLQCVQCTAHIACQFVASKILQPCTNFGANVGKIFKYRQRGEGVRIESDYFHAFLPKRIELEKCREGNTDCPCSRLISSKMQKCRPGENAMDLKKR